MQGTIVSDVPCQGVIARPYIKVTSFKHHKLRSPAPAPAPAPSHPTPTLLPPSKMPAFGPSPNPHPLESTILILGGVALGMSYVKFLCKISNERILADGVSRSAQVKEMQVLKARLDVFDAKVKSGEVIGREEMEEGKRMERLFRCWLCSLENEAQGGSIVVTFEKYRGRI